MNCVECITNAEDGNLGVLKELQKNCFTYNNNQCDNFSAQNSFEEIVQDTLIQINPRKWSRVRGAFLHSLVLLSICISIFVIFSQTYVNTDVYFKQVGVISSIVDTTTLDFLREGDYTPSLFLYVSRNRHFSSFQRELKEFLYRFKVVAVEKTPTQVYLKESQDIVILVGYVTRIQRSIMAGTMVWINDTPERESHYIVWHLNGNDISCTFIGREVRLLTVLEETGLGGHLHAREWILV